MTFQEVKKHCVHVEQYGRQTRLTSASKHKQVDTLLAI